MGREIDNQTDVNTELLKRRSIRMAYTLNNTQLVQCTIVSDQPFFYIDEEVCMDEDGLFDDDFLLDGEEIAPELKANLLAIKKKIDTYDALDSTKTTAAENNTIKLNKGRVRKEDILNALSQSRLATEIIKTLTAQGFVIEENSAISGAHYNGNQSTIEIGYISNIYDGVLMASKAIRHAWQDYNEAYHCPLSFFPDHAVLAHRAQKADVDVFAIRMAWELRLAGNKELWAHVENSSLVDLARAFGREALIDFRSLNNGKAYAAAFETWFLSHRPAAQDKVLIQYLLDYQDRIVLNKDASEQQLFDMICKLGTQPYGKNYLQPYAAMMMQDSLFAEVRDRANANFLWFIKFERSFTEAEQTLEEERCHNGTFILFNDHIRDGNKNNDSEPANYPEDGSNIIPVNFGGVSADHTKLPHQS